MFCYVERWKWGNESQGFYVSEYENNGGVSLCGKQRELGDWRDRNGGQTCSSIVNEK